MKILSLVLVVLATVGLRAQDIGTDIIELKNGEQIIGTVIEQKPGAYIKVLLMPSDDTVTIELKDINRMLKRLETEEETKDDEAVVGDSIDIIPEEEPPTTDGFNERPFYFGIAYSTGGGDMPFMGLGISVMRSLSERLQVGVGLEAHANSSDGNGSVSNGTTGIRNVMGSHMPILGKVRYEYQKLWDGRFSFLAQMSLGYSVILNGDHQYEFQNADLKGGLYIEPSLGFRLNMGKDFGTIFSIGYQNLRAKSYYSFTDTNIKPYSWSNIVLKAGLFF